MSDLMASFSTQRPRRGPVLPEWDLAFVLYCLTRAPWEPLEDISIQRLTLKTFFLTLLASGRRRSDVQALDVTRCAFAKNASITVYPSRDFIPKTRAALEGNKAFSPVSIPSLSSFVGEGELDSNLCPVRALRRYIGVTKAFRRDRKRLFISYQRNRISDISTATLSNWVRLLVRLVYRESGADDRTQYKISPHQIRHLAMSMASKGTVPLEDIVRAGMWSTPTTFVSYYLSDASEVMAQSGRFRLGPIVTAQSIVSVAEKV